MGIDFVEKIFKSLNKKLKTLLAKIPDEKVTKREEFLNLVFPVAAFLCLIFMALFFAFNNSGINVYCEDKLIGFVQNQNTFEDYTKELNSKLSDEAVQDVDINLTAHYNLAFKGNKFNTKKEVEENLLNTFSGKIIYGNGIYVDDELIACNKNKSIIDETLDSILQDYRDSNPDATDVNFYNNVNVVQGVYPAAMEKDQDEIYSSLTEDETDTFNFTLNQGETLDTVANAYAIPKNDILKVNKNAQDAKPGDTIKISKTDKILNVKVTKEETYDEDLPFSTQVQSDSDAFVDSTKIVQEGTNGTQEKKDKVSYVNGKEVSRENIYTNITKPAVTKIISQGTKPLPQEQEQPDGTSTGVFIWPVPFTKNITSYFGMRWEKMHKGIDIAAAGVNGQDIIASDGGVVMQASDRNNGYGNCVIIKHNDKYSTLYGHCSAILVSLGQKVSQGQVIATVGSTGNATGPHLHFEIRENNTAVDPLTLLSDR